MTGDLPEFPAPWEPVTFRQIRDLLKLDHSISQPYLILAHSTVSVTAVTMLRELQTATCLRCLQVDLRDKSVKLSFCTYVGGGGRPLVPQSYYHIAFQCQLWVQEVPEAGLCIILHPA